VNINKEEDGMFVINNDNNKTSVRAKKVVLAL
jgi:hypothetical protein